MIGLALLSSVLAGIESLVHEYHVAMQKKIAAAASKARGVVEKAEKRWKIRRNSKTRCVWSWSH